MVNQFKTFYMASSLQITGNAALFDRLGKGVFLLLRRTMSAYSPMEHGSP